MKKSLSTILKTFDKTVLDLNTLIEANVKAITAKEAKKDLLSQEIVDLDQENRYALTVRKNISALLGE